LENHECTPEMMTDMSKNCPGQMMQSGKNMMGNEKPAEENTDTAGESHCGDMDSGMSSLMSSSGMKRMM